MDHITAPNISVITKIISTYNQLFLKKMNAFFLGQFYIYKNIEQIVQRVPIHPPSP